MQNNSEGNRMNPGAQPPAGSDRDGDVTDARPPGGPGRGSDTTDSDVGNVVMTNVGTTGSGDPNNPGAVVSPGVPIGGTGESARPDRDDEREGSPSVGSAAGMTGSEGLAGGGRTGDGVSGAGTGGDTTGAETNRGETTGDSVGR